MSARFGTGRLTHVVAILGIALLFTALGSWAQAAPQATPAGQLVDDALAKEAQGTASTRSADLQAALEKSPDYAPARWHLGFVKHNEQWRKYDDAARIAAGDTTRAAYRRLRDKAPNTVAGQVELARWCLEKKLLPEARAHYTRVVELSPDHAEAREKLGFRRVDGVWLNQREVAEGRERAAKAVADMNEWRPKLETLRKQFLSSNAKASEQAESQIRAIHVPAAIPAIEVVLCSHNEQTAQIALTTLSGMTTTEASVALARQALFSPWLFVRQAAVERLQGRDVDHFAPVLLAELHTPIQTRTELFRGPRGRLMYRHMLYREGQDNRELSVFDTAYQRIALPGGHGDDTLGRAVGDASRTAAAREAAVAQENARVQETNQRICQLLSYTSGYTLPPEPQLWWAWWLERNDLFQPGVKPLEQRYRVREVAVVDRTTGTTVSAPPATTMDCLAAGTKVWTIEGHKAIEQVQLGDQVLSQDPDTGELAYRPVLATTVRPAAPLMRIETDQGTIRTSGGHLFWQSGQGWVKARDLKRGAMLHTAREVTQVRQVDKVESEPTYNLVVADFHSYFVGEPLILSHDNTIRQQTNAIVPGYVGRR
jgi:hypothetical protein